MSSFSQSSSIDQKNLEDNDVNFLKLKFQHNNSLKTKLDQWCILNFVQLAKRNCPKIKMNPDLSNAYEVKNQVYESLY
jgi:hypothetical protein